MKIDIRTPKFDTSPAAIEKKRRLEINWLLEIGQNELSPEAFLRDFFNSDFLRNSRLEKQLTDESFSPPSPIPSEIRYYFSLYFEPDPCSVKPQSPQSLQSYIQKKILRHMGIKTWPPSFPISETEKADIVADAHRFLQGLSDFIESIKAIVQAGEQKYIPSVEAPSRISLDLDKERILRLKINNIEIAALGIVTLIKLLDGYPWPALKVCPQCEKVFFTLSKRQKFCSAECNSSSKYQKRIHKKDYHESRRLIARKYYLKTKKFMNDAEIAEIWRSEGIREKWIKRLLPEAS